MLKYLLVITLFLLPAHAYAETYLLMAEEDGCYWCAQWNKEIAPIYPKTAEGKAAPLRRYDLHGVQPDVQFEKSVRFTPTFILIDNGVEKGRIEGYPGDEFFWGLMTMMLKQAKILPQR